MKTIQELRLPEFGLCQVPIPVDYDRLVVRQSPQWPGPYIVCAGGDSYVTVDGFVGVVGDAVPAGMSWRGTVETPEGRKHVYLGDVNAAIVLAAQANANTTAAGNNAGGTAGASEDSSGGTANGSNEDAATGGSGSEDAGDPGGATEAP